MGRGSVQPLPLVMGGGVEVKKVISCLLRVASRHSAGGGGHMTEMKMSRAGGGGRTPLLVGLNSEHSRRKGLPHPDVDCLNPTDVSIEMLPGQEVHLSTGGGGTTL